MIKVMMGCPIFNIQSPIIRKNHKKIREISEHKIEYVEVIGASVEHAKQIMYKKFLESDCDYFFNVDADIFFFDLGISPIDILISADKDVIGGLYVYKKQPCLPTHRPLDLQEAYELLEHFPKDYKFNIPEGVHEVKWLSGGCMMMKREVIKKLTEKYMVPNLPMIHFGEYLSEDFSFCQRAIEEGYNIYADPRISLGHMGNYLYTVEDWKRNE